MKRTQWGCCDRGESRSWKHAYLRNQGRKERKEKRKVRSTGGELSPTNGFVNLNRTVAITRVHTCFLSKQMEEKKDRFKDLNIS